ncbi:MAG: AmmeMemoRadiSam system radical SAM enzyme [bacterium]
MNKEAKYYQVEDGMVRCFLCPNRCLIASGKTGRCLGRKNINGKLFATNYGEVVSMAVDPIEKKPLYHFYPGSEIFSVASYGCNLQCPFCQNWEISQKVAPSRFVPPEELVSLVKDSGCQFIAWTYTEPIVWFEYILDTGRLMHEAGIKNVLVTNGMINPEPLEELLPIVDAMNVDLKSFRVDFYRDYIKGDLETVLHTIRTARGRCLVEVTTLLIPGKNDSEAEIEELTEFVASLGRETVMHFSRFFPHYQVNELPTPIETLVHAAEIAARKLDYVYLGNVVVGEKYRDTFCPNCRTKLIDRSHYRGRIVGVKDRRCQGCGRVVDIVL